LTKMIEDVLSGEMRAELSADDGWKFTTSHIVQDVTGETAEARMAAAIAASGFVIGEVIGAFAPGCWLRSISCSPVGGNTPENSQYKIVCVYEDNIKYTVQIESGSTLNQIETNRDVNGNVIYVSYTYPAGHSLATIPPEIVTQGGLLPVLKPQRTVNFRVREAVDPAVPAAIYEGRVNSATWRGGAAGTWFCTGITGSSDNSGAYFDNVYSFQHKEEGWKGKAVFKDVSSGLPPADLDDSGNTNAEKDVVHYESANFGTLFS